MRILFASHLPHLPELIGGMERNTQALCRQLQARGIPCAVVAGLALSGPVSLAHRALRKLVPAAHAWPDRLPGHPVYRLWNPAAEIATALAFRPTVAVVQSWPPLPLAEALIAHGIPTVIYLHHVQFAAMPRPLRPDPTLPVLAASAFVAARLRETFGIEAAIVPPLVIPKTYRTVSRRKEVLFVNPRREKGDDIAWALAAARPDIPFRFVACWHTTPAERRAAQRRAKSLGNVTWSAPTSDMRRHYARAKLLLAPSRIEEAWCRVVTEAQVSDIPVLGSDRGALPATIGPGGLALSPDAGPAAWAEALAKLWDDAAFYAACAHATRHHAARPEIAPDRVVTDFIAHLASHVAAGAPAP